jgi:hypothetical protein
MRGRQIPKQINTALILVVVSLALILFARTFFREADSSNVTATAFPTPHPLKQQTISLPNGPLKQSVIAAGEYLVRQQISNGELSYQVDFMTGAREYSPSYPRLIGGAGALYTVCRVSGDPAYCQAGDLALDHYLNLLISEPDQFKGACLYTSGLCQLGGSAQVIDTIYKRWQATGDVVLGERNLIGISQQIGYFIISMRKPDGGFYHAFDPHHGGTADPNYFVSYSAGESMLALLELYEMTGEELWITQAHEVNDFMVIQPITEDHWHSSALNLLSRLDSLSKDDKQYALLIANTIIAGEVRSLSEKNSSFSSATKIEALASLSQALFYEGENPEWLDDEIRTFITFVRARQLPDNNCNWTISNEVTEHFGGGIFNTCDDPSIRVDGLQHYINGVTTYLEHQALTANP